jgi:hypothetical protein
MASVGPERSLRDTVSLIGTALAIGAGSIGLAYIVSRFGLGRQWFAFTWLTAFIFGAVGYAIPREIARRGRRLRKRWLPWGVFFALLVLHCATIGAIIVLWQPQWRFLEWTILTFVEFAGIGVVLDWTYHRS